MFCDQCDDRRINGIPCHEQGCPNDGAIWDKDSREWIKQRECRECGSTVDRDDPCCSVDDWSVDDDTFDDGGSVDDWSVDDTFDDGG